nr:hypothetical protein SEVIR_5G101050v2 [Setaria viridis]
MGHDLLVEALEDFFATSCTKRFVAKILSTSRPV